MGSSRRAKQIDPLEELLPDAGDQRKEAEHVVRAAEREAATEALKKVRDAIVGCTSQGHFAVEVTIPRRAVATVADLLKKRGYSVRGPIGDGDGKTLDVLIGVSWADAAYPAECVPMEEASRV